MLTNKTLKSALEEVINDLQTILLWIREDECKHLNVFSISGWKEVVYCRDCKHLVERND